MKSAEPEWPLVVAVVVNFNGLAQTVACVESLLAQRYPSCRVLVVDNGSDVDEAAVIQERFGEAVDTLRRASNGGYGAGANTGVRWALTRGAEYVWILNNDTEVSADALVALVEAMASDPRIGLASPQIRAPAGAEAPAGIWYSGGHIDLAAGSTRHDTEPISEENGPVDTGYVTGCAPIVTRAMFEEVGLFWEPLFLVWEDTDLCLRAQAAGWRTCVVPQAWIFHHVHGSTIESVVSRYHYRNALLVAGRHGSRRVLVSATATLGLLMVRLWGSALLRRRPRPTAASRGYLAGLRAFLPGARSI